MTSYLRIDGDELDLVGGRLMWQRGSCAGRGGIVFHLTAHGRRRILHLSGWAPGERVVALSGQVVKLRGSGPDAAVDGRFFAHAEVRFGRVRDDVAIISVDGAVEDIDPDSRARSLVEVDVRCAVQPASLRRFCLGCGRAVDPWASDRDEYFGGYRVRLRVLPELCPDCNGAIREPKFCPTCGIAFESGDVSGLSDADDLGYSATCAEGHSFSGNLRGGALPDVG